MINESERRLIKTILSLRLQVRQLEQENKDLKKIIKDKERK